MTTTPFVTRELSEHEYFHDLLQESPTRIATSSLRRTWIGSDLGVGSHQSTAGTNSSRVRGLAGLAVAGAMLLPQPLSLADSHSITTILSNRSTASDAASPEFDATRSTQALAASDVTVDAWPEQADASDVDDSPLRAVEDIKRWLSLNDGEVAELCGFSRRSLLNWRKGSDAYGASTRKLLAIHALVSSLNLNWGPGTTRLWFEGPDARGQRRIESIATNAEGLRLAIADVAEVLFVRPSLPNAADVNAGLTDAEVSAVMASPAMIGEPTARTAAKRVRKPGSARS